MHFLTLREIFDNNTLSNILETEHNDDHHRALHVHSHFSDHGMTHFKVTQGFEDYGDSWYFPLLNASWERLLPMLRALYLWVKRKSHLSVEAVWAPWFPGVSVNRCNLSLLTTGSLQWWQRPRLSLYVHLWYTFFGIFCFICDFTLPCLRCAFCFVYSSNHRQIVNSEGRHPSTDCNCIFVHRPNGCTYQFCGSCVRARRCLGWHKSCILFIRYMSLGHSSFVLMVHFYFIWCRRVLYSISDSLYKALWLDAVYCFRCVQRKQKGKVMLKFGARAFLVVCGVLGLRVGACIVVISVFVVVHISPCINCQLSLGFIHSFESGKAMQFWRGLLKFSQALSYGQIFILYPIRLEWERNDIFWQSKKWEVWPTQGWRNAVAR